MKLECPTCNQQAMSAMRKMFMGPARSARCESCHERVGVSFMAVLVGVPFIAAILAGLFIDIEGYVHVLLVVAAFLVQSVMHLWFVPLEVK